MSKWIGLLETLVGSRERATTLLTLRAAVSRQGLLPAERVRLIDLIADLDDAEQLFLAPWVAGLALDPAPAVRLRVFGWFHALSDGETQAAAALDEVFGASAGTSATLGAAAHATLVHLLGILRSATVDPETPFQALTALRGPVCALCQLVVLAHWARGGAAGDRERAVGLTSEVFEEELRERVEAWSAGGPLFLRYLILRWVGEAGVSLSADKSAAALLWERYAHDVSPIVAVAALEALGRQARPRDRSDLLDQLYDELRFFGRYARLQELSHEDVRALHVGLLGAVAQLTLESLPGDTAPLARFVGLLRQPHSPLLDVVQVTNPRAVPRVVHAALSLFGSEVRILADVQAQGYGRYRLLGRSVRLRAPAPGRYLLHATPSHAAPMDWQFHWAPQGVPAAAEPHACDLLALTTPAVSAGLDRREAVEAAIDLRGWWMLEAFERTAALLRALERLEVSDHRDDLLNYLRTLAGAANLARRDPSAPDAIRNRLKVAITSILVSQLATHRFFAHLFPGDGVDDPLDAGLLVAMGLVALRALPQEPGYRWIEANVERLLEVATGRYADFDVRLRSRAWVVLKFHAIRTGRPELEGALAGVRFAVNEVFACFAPALWSHPDDRAVLERLERLGSQDGAPGLQGARAEVLARHLERDVFSQAQAHAWARSCLADEKFPEASHSRRRLLIGYARCSRPIEGPVRRLRDLLLRTASAEELDLYLRLRPELAEDDVRRIVWMRFEQTDRDLVFSGRRLDVQRVTDGLRRALVLEAEICRRAAGDPTFFRRYLTARGLERGPQRRAGAALFRGRVLGSALEPEVLVVPDASSEAGALDLAKAVALAPAFVHPELDAAEVQGIATFHASIAGAIDLHTVPAKRREGLLRDRLAGVRSVQLLARVAAPPSNGEMQVDLGAALPGLPQRQRLEVGAGSFAEDDPVVVLVRGQVRPCARIRRLWLRVVEDSLPEQRVDPAQIQDLSGWLCDRAAARDLEGLVLRGRVRGTWYVRERRRCALDLGGLQQEDGAAWECPAEDGQALYQGQSVWVRVERADLSEVREEVVEASVEPVVETLLPSCLLPGHLVPQNTNGRREWEAHLGPRRPGAAVVIPGPEMTADLRTFLELQRLPPEAAESLSRRQRLLASDGNAKRVSLLRAPALARWTRVDVLAGLFAGQVVALTAVGPGAPPGTQRFELRVGPSALGKGLLDGFGDLADLRPEDLIWWKGQAPDQTLASGVRLELAARWGTVQADGRTESAVSGPYPHLHVTRTDEENVTLCQRFRAGGTVRVAVRDGRWAVQEDEFPWFQPWLPTLEWLEGEPARTAEGDLEVLTAADWDPFEPWRPLWVKRIQSNGLWLGPGTALREAEVLRFVRIAEGTVLFGGPNTGLGQQWGDGRLYARMRGLKVFIPPTVAYLLPPGTNLSWATPEEFLIQSAQRVSVDGSVSFDKDDLPNALAAVDPLGHLGLVAEVLIKTKRARVIWLDGGLDLVRSDSEQVPRVLGESWTPLPDSWRTEPGDLLLLSGSPQTPRLGRVRRGFTGTFLFRKSSLERLPAERLEGRLLRRGAGDEDWIFSVVRTERPKCPPRLLFVPSEQIARPMEWDDVEPLAGVTLRVQITPHDLRLLARERGAPRPLPSLFQAQRPPRNERGRTFVLRPAGGQAPQDLPGLEYTCGFRDPHEPALNAGQVQVAFDLSIRGPDDDAVWTLELQPRLVSPARRPAAPGPARRPRLEEMFGEQPTRPLGGRAFQREGRWFVRLDSYDHDDLPLPESEISWIPGRESALRDGWKGMVCVRRTGDHFAASLRQLPPKTLEQWLKDRRLRPGMRATEQRVGYYGPVPRERVEALFHAPPALQDGEEYVLFEDGLGAHVLVGATQLTHFGDAFDPNALHCGDLITSFEVLAPTEKPEERRLDIINHLPDLLQDINRFHEQKGIFFGRVAVRTEGADITELRGLWNLYRDRGVPQDRLGRWQLRLMPPDEEDLAWLRTLTEEQFAYFRFDHADAENGLLFFRVIGREELFKQQHLLYVRADGVERYGRSWLLAVRLLDEPGRAAGGGHKTLQRHQSRYVIPDSLFSVRRGRLRTSRRAAGRGLFLAVIQSAPSQHAAPGSERDPWVRLSLVGVPDRPFRFLFSRRDWQVIVCQALPKKGTPKPEVRVEAIDTEGTGDGVNVKLRLDRVEGFRDAEREAERPIRPGAVLVLRADLDRRRLQLVDVVPSHLDYLHDAEGHLRRELLLTVPWGGVDYRQKRAGRDDQEVDLVGLPQLEGNARLTPELAERGGTIPQIATAPNRDRLVVRPWAYTETTDRLAGQLLVGMDGHPSFLVPGIRAFPLPWDAVTVLDRTPEGLAWYTRERRWRDRPPVAPDPDPARERKGEPPPVASDQRPDQGIANSVAVARRHGGRVSLTEAARHPFPVDHLTEQFGDPASPERGSSRPQTMPFPVARADKERLVLEVAPGRYVALPCGLIAPLHAGELASSRAVAWQRLERGDLVEIERVVRADGAASGFLDRFRIRRIEAGATRPFTVGCVLPSQWEGSDAPRVGVPGLHLGVEEPDVEYVHLRRQPNPSRGLREGRGTVIFVGTVLGRPGRDGDAWVCQVDIGRRFGERDAPLPPAVRVPSYLPVPREGDAMGLRIEDRAAKDSRSPREEGVAALPWLARRLHKTSGGFQPSDGTLGEGDCVFVVQGSDGHPRVAGFEGLQIVWQCEGDALLARFAQAFFERPGAVLAATVEAPPARVDRRWSVALSRRKQLERVLPGGDEAGRASVVGTIGQDGILLHVLGVPCAMPADALCHGRPSATLVRELLADLTREGPLEVEVVRKGDGTLTALGVYQSPSHGSNVTAVVEAHAAAGVLVNVAGCRGFVERRDLAWCHLPPALLARAFPLGSRLAVHVLQEEGGMRLSHVLTPDVRNEIRSLSVGAPVYVVRVADAAEGSALVRGRSGVLFELFQAKETQEEERFCAFVRQIDHIERRVILSPHALSARTWDVPELPADCIVDAMGPEVLVASLEELVELLEGRPQEVPAWVSAQGRLDASPKNLRNILETIFLFLGPQVPWAAWAAQAVTPHRLGLAWAEVTEALASAAPTEPALSVARFALGWWALRTDQADRSRRLLESCRKDLGDHVEVELAYAIALHRVGEGKKARSVLRATTSRLWSGAAQTLPLPLLLPALQGPNTWQLLERFARQLGAGEPSVLEAMALREHPRTASHQALAAALWAGWARLAIRRDAPRFDEQFHELLERLHDERLNGVQADPRLHLLAARLLLARGDLARAWVHLEDALPLDGVPEGATAAFWGAWLQSEPAAGDRLLQVLERLRRWTDWRESTAGADALIAQLTHALSGLNHVWRLARTRYRIVPEPPPDAASLDAWADRYNGRRVLAYIRSEREATVVEEADEA